MQPIQATKPIPARKKFSNAYFNTTRHMAGEDFVHQWGLEEACRELLANLIDQAKTVALENIGEAAQIQFKQSPGCLELHNGDKLLAKVTFAKKKDWFTTGYRSYTEGNKIRAEVIKKVQVYTRVLEFVSYASAMPFMMLHSGKTSKKKNLGVIGVHGEGLTAACVVLGREGHDVTIESVHDGYRAHIVHLRDDIFYQMDRECSKALGDQTVRIRIVFHPEWTHPLDLPALVRSVKLSPADIEAAIATDYGHVLVAPHMRGKIFVREMFVTTDANCLFGYNFNDPEKTLLQDRDRKACEQNGFLTASALSISQVTMEHVAQREEVLKCFLYAPGYDPNGPEEAAPKRYKDLMSDVPLTALAIDALRRHCEATRVPEGQKAMFLSVDSPELKEIRRLLNLVPVFCLPALHNHATIVRDFRAMLVRDAQELDQTTRVGALKEPLQDLLNVRELRQFGNVDANVGIWLVDGVAYMTGVYSFGSAKAIGFTRSQLCGIISALRFADVDSQATADILELLRRQPMPEPLPESVPLPSSVRCEAALEEKEGEPLQDRAAEEQDEVMNEGEMAMETEDLDSDNPAGVLSGQIHGSQALPPLERLHVTSGAANAASLINEPAAQDNLCMGENEAGGNASVDSASSSASVVSASVEHKDGADAGAFAFGETSADEEVEGDWYSESEDEEDAEELGSESYVYESSEDSDGSDSGSDHSEDPSSSDGSEVYENNESADHPPPKRLKRARADTTGAPTAAAAAAVCAAPPHTPHLPLDPLPLETSLGGMHHPVVHQLNFRDEFGVWMYSDDATSEQTMVPQLEACVPTPQYRAKLRALSSLCNIVVFVSADKRALPAFNLDGDMCINLDKITDEEMFKYCVDAQLKSLDVMK